MRPYAPIKLVKNNVNSDDIGVESIYARRVDHVIRQSAEARVPPAVKMVGEKPPNVSEQMRTRQRGDLVPEDTAGWFLARGKAGNPVEVFEALRIDVYFRIRMLG